MKRLVIYTCITGGYDTLPDPSAVCPYIDYVCFTDSPTPVTEGVWEFRPLSRRERTATLTSRWHKLHPHELFPDCEYTLWIDGNVTIADVRLYDRLESMMTSGVTIAGLRHPSRDDVYEEALRILHGRRETLPNVMNTARFLRREGMPRHFGLYESNVILRRHGDPGVIAFDNLWWDMLHRFSGRDQLSQTYCLWKTGLSYDLILPDGSNVRNHPFFGYTLHGPVYVKQKTVKGRLRDASTAFNEMIFKLWGRLSGVVLR